MCSRLVTIEKRSSRTRMSSRSSCIRIVCTNTTIPSCSRNRRSGGLMRFPYLVLPAGTERSLPVFRSTWKFRKPREVWFHRARPSEAAPALQSTAESYCKYSVLLCVRILRREQASSSFSKVTLSQAVSRPWPSPLSLNPAGERRPAPSIDTACTLWRAHIESCLIINSADRSRGCQHAPTIVRTHETGRGSALSRRRRS